MKAAAAFDVVRDVLDHEIVDADGLPCGAVDDVELSFEDGAVRVVALLVGPGAMQDRMPSWAAAIVRRVAGARRIRVPWSEIETLGTRVVLARNAAALGLGVADRRWGRRIAKVPGA